MELPQLCYGMAYFALPELLFSDPERVIGYFTNNEYPTGPYLYAMATRLLQVEINRDDIRSFQAHTVELKEGIDCYILEYPEPPAFNLRQRDHVLCPFFSAIIRDRNSSRLAYHTLGQNPLSGTTFRKVTPDGANANLGAGPEPDIDAFIAFLKERF